MYGCKFVRQQTTPGIMSNLISDSLLMTKFKSCDGQDLKPYDKCQPPQKFCKHSPSEWVSNNLSWQQETNLLSNLPTSQREIPSAPSLPSSSARMGSLFDHNYNSTAVDRTAPPPYPQYNAWAPGGSPPPMPPPGPGGMGPPPYPMGPQPYPMGLPHPPMGTPPYPGGYPPQPSPPFGQMGTPPYPGGYPPQPPRPPPGTQYYNYNQPMGQPMYGQPQPVYIQQQQPNRGGASAKDMGLAALLTALCCCCLMSDGDNDQCDNASG